MPTTAGEPAAGLTQKERYERSRNSWPNLSVAGPVELDIDKANNLIILLNDREVAKLNLGDGAGAGNITAAYPLTGKGTHFLATYTSGYGPHCHSQNFILEVKPDGNVIVSPRFGNCGYFGEVFGEPGSPGCNKSPKCGWQASTLARDLTTKDGALIIRMPVMNKYNQPNLRETYIYKNGMITKNGCEIKAPEWDEENLCLKAQAKQSKVPHK